MLNENFLSNIVAHCEPQHNKLVVLLCLIRPTWLDRYCRISRFSSRFMLNERTDVSSWLRFMKSFYQHRQHFPVINRFRHCAPKSKPFLKRLQSHEYQIKFTFRASVRYTFHQCQKYAFKGGKIDETASWNYSWTDAFMNAKTFV